MKLFKITLVFIALVSLQIAAAQWLHVPPPVEAKNLMIFTAGVPVVAPAGISDDFSSDTSANYTVLAGGLSITGGVAKGTTNWAQNLFYHETTVGSADQTVQATVTYNGIADGGQILGRYNVANTTGYMAVLQSGDIKLFSLLGTTQTYIALYDATYASGTYVLKLTLSGTTIKVFVDGTERISVTNATYSTGDYCGFAINRGGSGYDGTVDDFTATTP